MADHTLWDYRVAYFTNKEWCCSRYCLLGYGESIPSGDSLPKEPHSPAKDPDHTACIAGAFFASDGVRGHSANGKLVSCGACKAIYYPAFFPQEFVNGLMLCAGGLGPLVLSTRRTRTLCSKS